MAFYKIRIEVVVEADDEDEVKIKLDDAFSDDWFSGLDYLDPFIVGENDV